MVSICHLEKCFWKLNLTYMHRRWNYLADQARLLACLLACVCVCVCVCVQNLQNKPRPWLDGLTQFSYEHFFKKFENILTCFFSESFRQGYTWAKDFTISKNSPLVGLLLNGGKYARETMFETVARIKRSWSSFSIFPFSADNSTLASL